MQCGNPCIKEIYHIEPLWTRIRWLSWDFEAKKSKAFSGLERHLSNLMSLAWYQDHWKSFYLWVKMTRCSVYNLRIEWFYAWKLRYDMISKIPTWNSLTFHWHFPLFRISLTIFQIPWQFPDLEKINFSLTFPWRVATLFIVEHYSYILVLIWQIYFHSWCR